MDKATHVLGSSTNAYSNDILLSFTEGLAWDKKLHNQEIKVQIAWLDVLEEVEVIDSTEKVQLYQALKQIKSEMDQNKFEWKREDEDIHMNIERALTEKLGDLGKKIHCGRSRNDLIATTMKLHVSDLSDKMIVDLNKFAEVLFKKANEYKNLIVPGATHLQHAQPISMGQILLSHAWPVLRVKQSFSLAKRFAMNSMPLGAAAFNGTTLSADYEKLATKLGFSTSCLNSYDSVGERDAILQIFSSMQLQAVHLAKLAHDIIYWSSTPVSLLKLPLAWSTGSSIMPNKRNPDVAELIRAKSLKIIAKPAFQIMSSFGSSYFSDLHELKKIYLETADELMEIHNVMIPFIEAISFDRDSAKSLLGKGHLMATDFANQLANEGKSFREAYKITAEYVAKAELNKMQIHDMGDVKLDYQSALEARSSSGGSSSAAFEKQCEKFIKCLEKEESIEKPDKNI